MVSVEKFEDSIQKFEERLLEKLISSNYVEHVMMEDVLDPISKAILIEAISKPFKIEIEDEGLIFLNEAEERITCPNFGSSISADGQWLSEKLPFIPFDIEQAGNLRKAEEAESAYFCAMIVIVLKDSIFKDEFLDVVNNYDYQGMKPLGKSSSFKQLLTEWQDLQSKIISVVISASKFKISSLKKDTEKFLRDGIPADLVIGLRDLDEKIRGINKEYSTTVLSPENVKLLTKIEILQYLQDKGKKIKKLQENSKVDTLYSILHLSSEYINPIIKKRLKTLARVEVEKLYSENPNFEIIVGEKNFIVDSWKKRYINLSKVSVRRREVLKYLSDPNNYVLPSKL